MKNIKLFARHHPQNSSAIERLMSSIFYYTQWWIPLIKECNTSKHNVIQCWYNTMQYNTIQYNAIHRDRIWFKIWLHIVSNRKTLKNASIHSTVCSLTTDQFIATSSVLDGHLLCISRTRTTTSMLLIWLNDSTPGLWQSHRIHRHHKV